MLKACLKITLICVIILVFTLVGWAFLRLKKPNWRDTVFRVSTKVILAIVGVKLTKSGQMSKQRPLLLISNHLSYLDILILVRYYNIRFTPKSEIKSWPFLGWLCQVQGSVFVERKATKVKEVGNNIQAALQAGEAICLFPEASTGNGLHMLPFKSSFFSLADQEYNGRKLAVQPVAISYRKLRNLPISMSQWPEVAWYGDMELVPHLWNLLKIAPLSVHVSYLEPVTIDQFAGRKELAAYCQQAIEQTIKA